MKFFPLAFLLHFFKPKIQINGYVYPARWGKNVFDLPAAQYHVRCYFPYVLAAQTCPAEMFVPLYVGHVTVVEYSVPFVLIGDGSIRQTHTMPMGGGALPPAAERSSP